MNIEEEDLNNGIQLLLALSEWIEATSISLPDELPDGYEVFKWSKQLKKLLPIAEQTTMSGE